MDVGILGSKGHKSATLCGYCIDVTDMGNMMFGLGGAARGYSLGRTYGSASLYNVLRDWLVGPNKDVDGLLKAFFDVDGRGAITGWLIGSSNAFLNRDVFCGAYSIGRLAGGNENAGEALQCAECAKPQSPSTRAPSSLLKVSRREGSTILELKAFLGDFGY